MLVITAVEQGRRMANKASQEGGDNSFLLQAGRDVHYHFHMEGVPYDQMRPIAEELFSGNFERLPGTARDEAHARAGEILEAFIGRLRSVNPGGVVPAGDPGFQLDLFSAQRGYARRGEGVLKDVLVDLLVRRAAAEEPGLMQLVLGEALDVASRLTEAEYHILSFIFLLRGVQHTDYQPQFSAL